MLDHAPRPQTYSCRLPATVSWYLARKDDHRLTTATIKRILVEAAADAEVAARAGRPLSDLHHVALAAIKAGSPIAAHIPFDSPLSITITTKTPILITITHKRINITT
jgi:hypothetical protein